MAKGVFLYLFLYKFLQIFIPFSIKDSNLKFVTLSYNPIAITSRLCHTKIVKKKEVLIMYSLAVRNARLNQALLSANRMLTLVKSKADKVKYLLKVMQLEIKVAAIMRYYAPLKVKDNNYIECYRLILVFDSMIDAQKALESYIISPYYLGSIVRIEHTKDLSRIKRYNLIIHYVKPINGVLWKKCIVFCQNFEAFGIHAASSDLEEPKPEEPKPEEPVSINDPEILREMKEIAIKTMANQVFLVERNIYRRYITGYRAVFCEGGSLTKEVFKTEQEARRACVINGRVPKRVEVVYSLYMVRGELKNGETYEKVFKHEKDARKFAEKASNNGTLEGVKVIKIACS